MMIISFIIKICFEIWPLGLPAETQTLLLWRLCRRERKCLAFSPWRCTIGTSGFWCPQFTALVRVWQSAKGGKWCTSWATGLGIIWQEQCLCRFVLWHFFESSFHLLVEGETRHDLWKQADQFQILCGFYFSPWNFHAL